MKVVHPTSDVCPPGKALLLNEEDGKWTRRVADECRIAGATAMDKHGDTYYYIVFEENPYTVWDCREFSELRRTLENRGAASV
jgi:hypothetical protein